MEFANGEFRIWTDGMGSIWSSWGAEKYCARWERIERDDTAEGDTPESVLKSCHHSTFAVFRDEARGVDVAVDIDENCRIHAKDRDGMDVWLTREQLDGINEAVARHDAANGGA